MFLCILLGTELGAEFGALGDGYRFGMGIVFACDSGLLDVADPLENMSLSKSMFVLGDCFFDSGRLPPRSPNKSTPLPPSLLPPALDETSSLTYSGSNPAVTRSDCELSSKLKFNKSFTIGLLLFAAPLPSEVGSDFASDCQSRLLKNACESDTGACELLVSTPCVLAGGGGGLSGFAFGVGLLDLGGRTTESAGGFGRGGRSCDAAADVVRTGGGGRCGCDGCCFTSAAAGVGPFVTIVLGETSDY